MEGISLAEFMLIGLFLAFLHGGIKAWQDKHIQEDINLINFFSFFICIYLGLSVLGKSWLGMIYPLCVGIYLCYNAMVISFFYLIRLLKGLITQKEKGKEEVA